MYIFICAFLGPESIERSEEQWTWLEETLSSSKAHYLIVGGHYPVWSIAEHGPTQCLVDRLRPLLEKYKVTAYISGHDHNLQVINISQLMTRMIEFSSNKVKVGIVNIHYRDLYVNQHRRDYHHHYQGQIPDFS